MISGLIRCNEHLYIFRRLQIGLALQVYAILLSLKLKTLLVLIYTKYHSKSCYYRNRLQVVYIVVIELAFCMWGAK